MEPDVAASTGKQALVEFLIRHGADPNAKTDDGWSGLVMASGKGYQEIVLLLTAAGARE